MCVCVCVRSTEVPGEMLKYTEAVSRDLEAYIGELLISYFLSPCFLVKNIQNKLTSKTRPFAFFWKGDMGVKGRQGDVSGLSTAQPLGQIEIL